MKLHRSAFLALASACVASGCVLPFSNAEVTETRFEPAVEKLTEAQPTEDGPSRGVLLNIPLN